MKDTTATYGYCHVVIEPYTAQQLLRSNSERAFIVAQLQDLLSPRLIINDIPAHRQLASCIDLLAFSISTQAIHLLLFTIDFTIAKDFAHRIAARLSQYQADVRPSQCHAHETNIHIEILKGPHHALSHSVYIHLLHNDWEYDRYSSIGFYLHDRRGDWMRTWRMAHLYENDSELYYTLLKSYLRGKSLDIDAATVTRFASFPLLVS